VRGRRVRGLVPTVRSLAREGNSRRDVLGGLPRVVAGAVADPADKVLESFLLLCGKDTGQKGVFFLGRAEAAAREETDGPAVVEEGFDLVCYVVHAPCMGQSSHANLALAHAPLRGREERRRRTLVALVLGLGRGLLLDSLLGLLRARHPVPCSVFSNSVRCEETRL
jgi:hypothetical protein